MLEDLLESLRLSNKDQLDDLVDVIQNTTRNRTPDEQNGYEIIKEAVDSILADYQDAEGTSDVEIEQGKFLNGTNGLFFFPLLFQLHSLVELMAA